MAWKGSRLDTRQELQLSGDGQYVTASSERLSPVDLRSFSSTLCLFCQQRLETRHRGRIGEVLRQAIIDADEIEHRSPEEWPLLIYTYRLVIHHLVVELREPRPFWIIHFKERLDAWMDTS